MTAFKNFFYCSIVICLIAGACKKDSTSVDYSPNYYLYNGGSDTNVVKGNLLLFGSSDTLTVPVTVSSTNVLPVETTVTFAIADTARTNYNTKYGFNYQAMPADAYHMPDTIIMVAGKSLDTLQIEIYKSKLDPAKDYMLPVAIADAQGNKISTSSQTILLPYKSSTLGGIYSVAGIKTEYIGAAADNNLEDTVNLTTSKAVVPDSLYYSHADYADLGPNGWQYILMYNETTGEFTVTPNDVILSSVADGSFSILSRSYNQATRTIYIKSSYKNSSGNERVVEETLTPQK